MQRVHRKFEENHKMSNICESLRAHILCSTTMSPTDHHHSTNVYLCSIRVHQPDQTAITALTPTHNFASATTSRLHNPSEPNSFSFLGRFFFTGVCWVHMHTGTPNWMLRSKHLISRFSPMFFFFVEAKKWNSEHVLVVRVRKCSTSHLPFFFLLLWLRRKHKKHRNEVDRNISCKRRRRRRRSDAHRHGHKHDEKTDST